MFDRELDRYWKTVVNTIRDGIVIINTSGTIVAVNQAFESITGYRREEVIGQTCEVMRCDICEQVMRKDSKHWCALFGHGALDARRCQIRHRDGQPIPALKNAALLHDRQGNVIGAVETVTDLSEIIEKDNQLEAFRQELRSRDGFHGIIGTSPPMRRVFDLIENAARSDAPVIIYGESGTGKELVSRAIHDLGDRGRQPFVKVNCASLTETLLESELFGHVRGAYTGAYRDRVGRFEMAHGGDIFLDEIGDLPLATQVKLLRVLEEKVIERVGDSAPVPVDVRIISATNQDLEQLIRQGDFRDDFFFRINVIPIHLPPLRERCSDIPLLADSIFRRLRLKSGKPIEGISNAAMERLMQYRWPGNVRELRSAFEYAFVTCREPMIQPHHLPANLCQARPGRSHGEARNLRESERQELVTALELTGGNQSRAARLLGVSRVTVWNRLKRHNIDPHKFRGSHQN